MENNGKGAGIFYGVIGVATLVITIIGATFAYFSATTNSAENAVTAGGAKITLAYDDSINATAKGLKQNLIPVDPEKTGFNIGYVGAGDDKCKDDNGNNICSVYTFTVSNPEGNTVAQRIFGTVTPKSNTFTNFHFAIFKGEPSDVDSKAAKTVVPDDATDFNDLTQIKLTYAKQIKADAKEGDSIKVGWDVDGTPVTSITTEYDGTFVKNAEDATRKHVVANKGDLVFTGYHVTNGSTTAIEIPAFEQVLDVTESRTYTIVMWIQETGSAQNEDQEKSFAGGVNFTTEGSGSGVTGVITANSQS